MEDENQKHSLSIFLIKENYENIDDCTQNLDKCDEHLVIPISGVEDAHLFLASSKPKLPDWQRLFPEVTNWNKYKTKVAKGLLIIQSKNGRWFAITFGFGKSFLNSFAFEENFGFRTVINSIDPDSLKSIDHKSIIENPIQSKKQITKSTDLSHFNVDEFIDILSKMRGESKVSEFGATLDGKDSLKINVEIDLGEIPDLLDSCLAYYSSELYKKYFPEIDNISDVRDKDLLQILEEKLLSRISDEQYDFVWASIPEIYDEDDFICFHYSSDRKKSKDRFYDIELKDYINSKKPRDKKDEKLPKKISRPTLQRDHVMIRKKSNYAENKWKVWNCIYTEFDIDGRQYLFFDGKWYLAGEQYVDQINKQYSSIRRDDPDFPIWNDLVFEKDYLKDLDLVKSNEYCCMDRREILHGGGRSRIEFCDLFTPNNELIHVKKYGGSSVLSHLFNQGEVSAGLFLDDQDFRKQVEEKLDEGFSIQPDIPPDPQKYTIWFLIGTKYFDNPNLPLFSRMIIINTFRELRRYRFNVRMGFIEVKKETQK